MRGPRGCGLQVFGHSGAPPPHPRGGDTVFGCSVRPGADSHPTSRTRIWPPLSLPAFGFRRKATRQTTGTATTAAWHPPCAGGSRCRTDPPVVVNTFPCTHRRARRRLQPWPTAIVREVSCCRRPATVGRSEGGWSSTVNLLVTSGSSRPHTSCGAPKVGRQPPGPGAHRLAGSKAGPTIRSVVGHGRRGARHFCTPPSAPPPGRSPGRRPAT